MQLTRNQKRQREVRVYVQRRDRKTGEVYFVDNPKGPSGRMESLLKLATTAKRALKAAEKSLRAAKRDAYRMAVRILQMRARWPEEFKAKIAPATYDEFVKKTFAPLIALGGDPFELLMQIENGLTLSDYVEHGEPTSLVAAGREVAGRIGM